MTTRTPAVVIGAGPYGLSVAANLSARGIQPRVFGEVMSSWRSHMPAGMCLKSTPDASSLSAAKPGYQLADYCISQGLRPLRDENDDIIPIELFSRYGQWFQEQVVPQVEQSVVTQVERAGTGFVVTLDTGAEILTPTVVVATGVSHVDYIPDELAALAPGGRPSADGPVSHPAQHNSLTGFRDRRVAVIGAGQSALESAALLHEAGADVTVLVRGTARWGSPPKHPTGLAGKLPQPHSPLGPTWRIYPFSHAPGYFHYLPEETRLKLVRRVLGPLGAWWLRDRVDGVLPVLNQHAVRQAALDGDERAAVHHLLRRAARRAAGGPRPGGHRLPGRPGQAGLPGDRPAAADPAHRQLPGAEPVVRVVGAWHVLRRAARGRHVRPGHAVRLRRRVRGAPGGRGGRPGGLGGDGLCVSP